jgi:hypothetical protein
LRAARVDMVGSLPAGCTGLGRSSPEEERLAEGNEEVNRTDGQPKGKKG